MARRLELLIAACLYYSGLVKLAHWWMQKAGKRLVVLCYHNAGEGYLRQHLLYLNRYYRILHLEEALGELYNPHSNSEDRSRDQRTLLTLTFDDGYHDNYTDGFPLVSELQIPITIFLVPGYIVSGERFWWQESKYLLNHTQVSEATIEGRTYRLCKSNERKALAQVIDMHLQNASSITRREEFLATIRKVLLETSAEDTEEKAQQPLTWEEVREMEESGWVSFGAHTLRHPTLISLSDLSEMQYEVSECRLVLERQLGHPVRTFAYPIGKHEHIGKDALLAVQKAKYDWALTAIHGCNTPQTNPYFLYRIVVDVDQHWLMVAAKASGAWDMLVYPWRTLLALTKNIFRSKMREIAGHTYEQIFLYVLGNTDWRLKLTKALSMKWILRPLLNMIGLIGIYLRCPLFLLRRLEGSVGRLPYRLSKTMARLFLLFNIRLIGIKEEKGRD